MFNLNINSHGVSNREPQYIIKSDSKKSTRNNKMSGLVKNSLPSNEPRFIIKSDSKKPTQDNKMSGQDENPLQSNKQASPIRVHKNKKRAKKITTNLSGRIKKLSGVRYLEIGIKDIRNGNYGSGLYEIASGSLRMIAFATLIACTAGLIFSPNKISLNNLPQDNSLDYFRSNITIENNFSRDIRIASVFDNSGKDRLEISNLTTANHEKYAERYGLNHNIESNSLVTGQCMNPITKTAENCSSYWNKVKYFMNWCEQPKENDKEEWAIYLDDDAVFTNFDVNPSEAIDQLRNTKDSSFIIATEGTYEYYPENEGGKERDSVKGAVNTGVMIVRKDEKGCGIIKKIWEKRNTETPKEKGYAKECPTYGICNDQRHGNEQGATDAVLCGDIPDEVGRSVTRIPPRDTTSQARAHIALNTANRDGCFQASGKNGQIGGPFTILHYDLKTNPAGIWRPRDWIGQTSGYPMRGRDLSDQDQNFCTNDERVPVTALRIKKVQEMISSAENLKKSDRAVGSKFPPIKEIMIGTAYENKGESKEKRDRVSSLTNADHFQYAKKWGLIHEFSSINLVKNACEDIDSETRQAVDCVGYWNKIQRILNWLEMNPGTGEKVFIVLDDDMVFLNNNIDPYNAIEQLGSNADVIIMRDVVNWLGWRFPSSANDPRAAVNTGLIIVRNTSDAKDFFNKVWHHRNDLVGEPDCLTLGLCKNQNCLHEQEAAAKVLIRNPDLLDKGIVSTLPPRSDQSTFSRLFYGTRIAANTFKRDGCFIRKQTNWRDNLFDYGTSNEEQDGACQKDDWLCQAAGVPLYGKKIGNSKTCRKPTDGEVQSTPETEIRYNYLTELLKTMKQK
jgi:Nucleotide-diphospho-sugar transferase